MKKEIKKYYGKDVTVYEYTFEETQQNKVELDEVLNFGKEFPVLKNGIFYLPAGRDEKQFVGFGQKEENGSEFVAVIDGLSIKQASNIMLDLGCIDFSLHEANLREEEIEEESIEHVAGGNVVVSDQPGIISWEEMSIKSGTIDAKDLKKKNK